MRLWPVLAMFALVGCRSCGDVGSVDDDRSNGGIVEPEERPDPVFSRTCETDVCSCTIGRAGGFCRTPYCGVTVQPDTVPRETLFIVTQSEADDDTLGRRACQVEPVGADLDGSFEAAVYYDDEDLPDDFFEDEIVAALTEPELTLADQFVLEPAQNRVSITTDGVIDYAATLLPRYPLLDHELGVETFTVDDEATYLRNVSRYEFSASFHDGTRFYVANGPRVLIWNDGVPLDPLTPPDVVLGTPDLGVRLEYSSSANFGGSARAIWSDGTKLAVVEGHRVLIWNRVPTESYAPADLVLGQDDFTTNESNRGGPPAADTLSSPMAVSSDGTRIVVAERGNHRFLVWDDFPTVNGQPADTVIGQQSFDENQINAGQLRTYEAWGVHLDDDRLALTSRFACECFAIFEAFPTQQNPTPDLLVGHPGALSRVDPTTFAQANSIAGFGAEGLALRNGHRVSIWNDFPSETVPAHITLGKPDDTLGGALGRISASSFASSSPFGHVWSGHGHLFVGDGRRLLVWRELPSNDFEPADLVIGQPGFATVDAAIDYRGIGLETLSYPTSVSSTDDLTVIADRANNRVLVLGGDPFQAKSIVVLGQPDATSFTPDGWGDATASTLDAPTSVFTDGTRIFVADAGNHRVLVWDDIPTEHGAPADRVVGQADFAGDAPNRGAEAGADTLHTPGGISYDGALYVADTYNHRVLVWDELPASNGAAADRVVGQPDFTSSQPNRGLGWFARGADTMARPLDVVVDDGTLFVSDSQNNRVLRFDVLGSASAVLGQLDFESDASPSHHTAGANVGFPLNGSTFTASAHTLRRPTELALHEGSLYVADTGNHRVLRWDTFATGTDAGQVVGQPDFETRAANENAVSANSLHAPEGVAALSDGTLFVADTKNHRLLAFDSAARDASRVFGQVGFERHGTNGSSPATHTVDGPAGAAFAADTLWVADRRNHRVLAYQDGEKVLTLGQFDAGSDFVNAGNPGPLGWTFDNPTAVWTDGERLVVADRNNHRVLIWNELPRVGQQPADVVVGQPDLFGHQPNAGGGSAATAMSLLAPEGVFVDGDVLYVADTGNNRVLVFDELPRQHGVRASRVLCQSELTENAANRGSSPTSDTCSNPTDVLATPDAIFVADAGNHRVLRFGHGEDDASLVLGQPDFSTRASLEEDHVTSARRFANPVRLAYDGSNLYVVDRGNHRVLIFDRLPTESFTPADRVLGQVDLDTSVVTPDPEGLDSPLGIAVELRPNHAARVWISDAGNDRVVAFDRVARMF